MNVTKADPHKALLAKWYQAVEEFDAASYLPGGGNGDSPEETAAHNRATEIADLITGTPSHSIEGVAAQMEYFFADYGDNYWSDEDQEHVALKAIHEGLQRLANAQA